MKTTKYNEVEKLVTNHGDASADPFLPEIFGGIMSVFTNNRTCNKNLIGDMAKKENNELEKRNRAFLRQEGNRSVRRNMSHYNLDMIIAVPIRLLTLSI